LPHALHRKTIGQELQEHIFKKAQNLSEMHSRCGQQSKKVITLNLSQKRLLGLMSFTPPN